MVVEKILDRNYRDAETELRQRLDETLEKTLALYRKYMMAMATADINTGDMMTELEEANYRLVRARVRRGKIERNRKVSSREGFTFRGGKLTRMTSQERLRRKRGARIGKMKRAAKKSRIKVAQRRSMRKRGSLGG